MTVLDPYVQHLADAAERLAARQAAMGVRGRLRARLAATRRGRLTALFATATLLAGGAAAAATELWRPQLGDERRGTPTASASSAPAEQLDRFGVLRREPTDADRSDAVRYALSGLAPHNVQGVRVDAVRGVGDRDVLVPAASADRKRDVLCLFIRDPTSDGGGLTCQTTSEILAGRAVIMTIPPPAPSAKPAAPPEVGYRIDKNTTPAELRRLQRRYGGARTMAIAPPSGPPTLHGIVPDGVAQVRQAGVAADVHDNVFHLTLPREMEPAVEWLDGDGRVIPPSG